MAYNYAMPKPYETIKVWLSTLQNLRMLHALTGESNVAILDRLVTAELQKVQKEKADAAKG